MSAFRSTFVSHAHADNDLCNRYVDAMGDRGIDVWYDRNNAQTGNFLGEQIQRELAHRSAFVLLLTKQSLDSFWVTLETQTYLGLMAKDRTRMLLPVRIGTCDVPDMLNAFFWVDALAMPFEEAIAKITSALAVGTPAATKAPAAPSHRSEAALPAPSLPPRPPDKTTRRPTSTGDVIKTFEMIPLESMQHLYDAYIAWYVDRVTRQLDNVMAGLRAELRENDAKEASFRPTPNELYAIERLQRSGVTGMDLLDRMVEQGEDWLMLTMRRLDQFERMGQAPKDYATWCEHALSGAYDWMDPERGGDTSAAPRANGPAQTSKVPEWMSNSPRQSPTQQGPDDNDDKGRNIFRIFTN